MENKKNKKNKQNMVTVTLTCRGLSNSYNVLKYINIHVYSFYNDNVQNTPVCFIVLFTCTIDPFKNNTELKKQQAF